MSHPQITQRGIAWNTCTRDRWDLEILEMMCTSCCQIFPLQGVYDLSLHDTLSHDWWLDPYVQMQ
jgi:hypothetical protein